MPPAGGPDEPLYGYTIEGWPGTHRWTSSSGMRSPTGAAVVMSATVTHQAANGSSIHVTAHRPNDTGFDDLVRWVPVNPILQSGREEWGGGADVPTLAQQAAAEQETARLQQAARQGRLPWEGAVVRVDGRPTIFLVTRFRSSWAAVGRGPGVDLTLAGHRSPVPAALARFEPAPPMRGVPFRGPVPRAERFPDEHVGPLTVDDVPPEQLVDLVCRGFGGRLVTGSVGGIPVRVDADIPSHEGTASGSFGGARLEASWRLGDNWASPVVDGTITATIGDRALSLAGTFHLDDDRNFQHGSVTGILAGEPITGQVVAAGGGLDDAGAFKIDALIGATTLTVFASVAGDLARAIVRGDVDGRPLELDVQANRKAETTSIRGRCLGPPALVAMVVGALLHFI